MSAGDAPYSLEFINGLIDKALALDWQERTGAEGGPHLPLVSAQHPGQSAGYLRLWAAGSGSPLDRMVHMRLQAGPVETQLLFLFGRAGNSMPHLHAQVVQFPPAGFVYNIDLLPRVDPVEDPDWFQRVFAALRRPYKQAVSNRDNSCAQAPANPMLAVYMSPWGIGSAQAERAELDRVEPSIQAYLEHYLALAAENWEVADPVAQARRDQRHLELFFADEMDPRAWNGVYRIVGEDAGHAVKDVIRTPLKQIIEN